MRLPALSLMLCLVVSNQLRAGNWPQWRGPGGNGVAAPGAYPITFSASENIAWKAPLPGVGNSTPAVWDEHIFVTCPIEDRDGVLCFDWNGKERWRVSLGPQRKPKHRVASASNPSPVTDGQHCFVYYKSGTVAALGFDGTVAWQLNLQKRFGKDTLWWDLGTSPVLSGSNVVIAVMHSGDSYLIALEKTTGTVSWKQPRNFTCSSESDQSYTTPLALAMGGRPVILALGADHLTAHESESGACVWTCGGLNPENKSMWRMIASPVVSEGVALVPFGRGKHLAGIRLAGEGDVSASGLLWKRDGIGADAPTPAATGGRAYLLSDRGKLTCLDVRDGSEQWSTSLPKGRSVFYASPVLAGDTLYCTSEEGIVFAGEVSGGVFRLLAENDMGERLVATPVPLNGKLLIRGAQHLFCVTR